MQNTGIYILRGQFCLQMKHVNLKKSTVGHGGFLKTLQTGQEFTCKVVQKNVQVTQH